MALCSYLNSDKNKIKTWLYSEGEGIYYVKIIGCVGAGNGSEIHA